MKSHGVNPGKSDPLLLFDPFLSCSLLLGARMRHSRGLVTPYAHPRSVVVYYGSSIDSLTALFSSPLATAID